MVVWGHSAVTPASGVWTELESLVVQTHSHELGADLQPVSCESG